MSDNLYEIARMMRDRGAFQKDMSEAAALVQNLFREKYFNKLSEAVQAQDEKIHGEPPKEIRLLRVLKEFRPEREHERIDRVIDMMLTASSLQNLRGTFANEFPAEKGPVHKDGVYDIDPNCVPKPAVPDFAGLLMMLALMGRRR